MAMFAQLGLPNAAMAEAAAKVLTRCRRWAFAGDLGMGCKPSYDFIKPSVLVPFLTDKLSNDARITYYSPTYEQLSRLIFVAGL